VQIYYKTEWIEDISISSNGDSISLSHLLDSLFAPRGINYLARSNHQYFVTGHDISVNSNIINTVTQNDSKPDNEAPVSRTYFGQHSYEKTVHKVIIGSDKDNTAYHKAYLSGRITNQANGEPVIGATVVVPGTSKGAITDPEGAFLLQIESGKTHNLQASCLGMESELFLVDMRSSGILNIEMTPKMIDMKEVVVKSGEHNNVRGMQMGFQNIGIKEIKNIPAVMGERDILKVANMMPGVQTVGEGSAGFNVRGSSSDENLFLLNDIPILNTGHFFGFFSAFNPDMISGFNLYKSNFPVEYSGRLASVFEISTRKGNKKKFGARGSLSPVTASIMLETPIVKDKSSVIISTRSTYSDWILNRLDNADLYERNASFYDIMTGVHIIGNNNDSWQFFGYYSKDKFALSTTNNYRYENAGGSITYNRKVFEKWNMKAAAVVSSYENYHANKEQPSRSFEHQFNVRSQELKINFTGYPVAGHKIGFGGNIILHNLNQGSVIPLGTESLLNQIDFGKETGLEYGLYAFDEISLTDKLTLYGGLRYSLFNYLGPNDVYTYANNGAYEVKNITDTIHYPAGKNIQHYSGPEYRLSLNYVLSPDLSVKMSYNRMRQYLFMLSNTAAVAPTDRWKLTDNYIAPPVADQLSLGIYKNFNSSSFETSAELYYKNTQNIIEYKDGADLAFNPVIETLVLQGHQKAYGIEFFIKRNTGRFTGWLSYAYARSLITVDGEEDWQKINQGLSYPANYDKPHAFNFVGNLQISRRLSFSSNVVYNTGRPISFPTGFYYVDGYQVINYSQRNEYRVPDYFRVDLSIGIEGNLKKNKIAHGSWMFSVYNLTGRKNAYSVYFNNDRGVIKGYQLSIYGVPIFTISYNFKLGNYAVE
ncbi:MAG: TonB-dependent receptor, partial [Bacteroidales bacterium]|nr:TonB-dependent receptor [Bacteroidales bacterium]